ncbi:MAG TPA: cysteine hydrolase [Syntrophorhabdaceae bacterium]|nr:cysteine hydrolase [Syntrophorhabdaceae bacterium]HQM80662.1 cysteine hydrolase [Syntrophorhabdaceae bacterium]
MKRYAISFVRNAMIYACLLITFYAFLLSAVHAQNIIDEWNTVKAPAAPELKPVTIDAKTTALLMLDFNKQTCNPERRPRCIASIPGVKRLLALARTKGAPVVYSLSPGAAAADIAQALAPRADEPVVASGPDKFLGTDLEKILKEKGVKTVIVVGTAAHGAVLYTASAAALRGFSVIVPVDGMSAEHPYAEQYVAWNLVNAPRVANQTTLTKIDLIR